jgi:hypothetical protein
MSNDSTSAYAAAELGSALRGADPGSSVREYAGLIDDEETIRILNYYDGLLDEPIEETEIGRLIIQNAATETIDEAVRAGSVSQMKSATGLTGNERDGGDLYGEAADQLSHEGAIGLVFGSPGSGKTATTLDIARSWKVRTGGSIIGNTSWSGFDRIVNSDREMLEAMAEIEGPVLAVLDEIAQELSGFGEGNKAAETFSDRLLFIRKRQEQHGKHAKRGSVLLIGHTRTKTAKSIRRVASFGINKPSRSDPGRAELLTSEGGVDEWDHEADFKGLTDTAESYPEREASSFDIIMDDEEEDDSKTPESIRKEEHIRTAIEACRSGMTYGDVSELVPFSQEWVGKVYRNWKDRKKHTEIVDPKKAPADD